MPLPQINPIGQNMRQGTTVVVPPVLQPVSLAEAKRQLRLDADVVSFEDDNVTGLIAAAHRHVENAMGHPLMTQTLETHLREFPCDAVRLPGMVNIQVVSITYIDTAGVATVLAPNEYAVDRISRPARVEPAYGKTWPQVRCQPGAVVIRWSAGYADVATVPDDLKHAMKLLIGHWDQNREAVVIGSISTEIDLALDALLRPYLLRGSVE